MSRIMQLEHKAVDNSQYSRRETIELNAVPTLEENVCKALLLAGVHVIPNDLQACHRMKISDRVIVKFKCCNQKIISCINAKT